MTVLTAILLTAIAASLSSEPWVPQQSPTHERLRAVCAVSARVAWASGNHGTVVKTVDGGAHWTQVSVPGADKLDFRGVCAADAKTAWLMSAGPGASSRIYRTRNGGADWTLLLTNPDSEGFFDSIIFTSRHDGVVLGDPVNGRFVTLFTHDGGVTWRKGDPAGMPAAIPGEGAFAASNTCLAAHGQALAFCTGGSAARVFLSIDDGRTWTAEGTPAASGTPMAGLSSICFTGRSVVSVGGDYEHPDVSAGAAVCGTWKHGTGARGPGSSGDLRANSEVADGKAPDPAGREGGDREKRGGPTWRSATGITGYRSCVARVSGQQIVAVGLNGSDVSSNEGHTWRRAGSTGYHACAFTARGRGWAVGENGRISVWNGG